MSAVSLPRLLQLASPTLPVGAYTYSQGLEWAVESGWIRDEASVLDWIGGLLEQTIGGFDAPLITHGYRAWWRHDVAEAMRLDALYIASRESAELRAETLQMGYSLRRLLADVPDLPRPDGTVWVSFPRRRESGVLRRTTQGPRLRGDDDDSASDAQDEMSFPIVWAGVTAAADIAEHDALVAYLWSWCENQTMAALKSVPLGQSAGQRLLAALGARLPAIARRAAAMPEDEWRNFAPGFAIACSRHETQYSRLFRS
jgi:urease accessory protein